MLSTYCKGKSINLSNLLKPEYMSAVMRKYGFRDWDSVLAAIGHGGLKEGQIVNKMTELYERDHKKILTNEEVLAGIEENAAAAASCEASLMMKSKSGIVVKGIADLSVRFSKCCLSCARRRDRRLCDQRKRCVHSSDRLCEYPESAGA